MLAIEGKYYDIAEAFLRSGANPEIHDQHGQTPLMKAVEFGSTSLVRLLMEKGADLHANPGKDFPGVRNRNKPMPALAVAKAAYNKLLDDTESAKNIYELLAEKIRLSDPCKLDENEVRTLRPIDLKEILV